MIELSPIGDDTENSDLLDSLWDLAFHGEADPDTYEKSKHLLEHGPHK